MKTKTKFSIRDMERLQEAIDLTETCVDKVLHAIWRDLSFEIRVNIFKKHGKKKVLSTMGFTNKMDNAQLELF